MCVSIYELVSGKVSYGAWKWWLCKDLLLALSSMPNFDPPDTTPPAACAGLGPVAASEAQATIFRTKGRGSLLKWRQASRVTADFT